MGVPTVIMYSFSYDLMIFKNRVAKIWLEKVQFVQQEKFSDCCKGFNIGKLDCFYKCNKLKYEKCGSSCLAYKK